MRTNKPYNIWHRESSVPHPLLLVSLTVLSDLHPLSSRSCQKPRPTLAVASQSALLTARIQRQEAHEEGDLEDVYKQDAGGHKSTKGLQRCEVRPEQ